MIHKKITIVIRGKDEGLQDALREATTRLLLGNSSGADSADDGGFYFETTEDFPKSERTR